jgi:hypothetical protein
LHDVVVVNDQSHAEWRVARAAIDGGKIVIPTTPRPPRDFFANPSSTYTIAALDGGDRARKFVSVTLDRGAAARDSYVFA